MTKLPPMSPPTSHPRTLTQWVEYIQTLHAREIDLTLDRVAQVFERLYAGQQPFKVIIVAGTNGKGSTSELLSSIYRQAGYGVGKYTSPHLVRFNERFNLHGESVDDLALIESFERVEAARDNTRLTFFEFGTLIAIDLFARAEVDLGIMEVGLGGRLDAVNILEPEVSVITNVALDHTAWLGDTLEKIAYEKFGVARPAKSCVLGMREPPAIFDALADERSVNLIRIEKEFDASHQGNEMTWQFSSKLQTTSKLPLPFNQAGHQLDNAASALATVEHLQAQFPVNNAHIRQGIAAAVNAGRCEIIQTQPFIVIDVAHNEASVAGLATFIEQLDFGGKLYAVCGMLKDKQITPALRQIATQVDSWYLASIDDPRGSTSAEMAEHLNAVYKGKTEQKHKTELSEQRAPSIELFDDVVTAFNAANMTLDKDDCLVVFGSFFITGDIIAHLA